MKRQTDTRRQERGFTLIEMVIAMAMAVVLTGAAVAMLVSVLQRQPDLTERADQIGQANSSIEKFVREIRQGVVGSVKANTATGFEFETYVDGKCGTAAVTTATKCKVVYACASEICTRTTGTTTTSVTRLAEGVKNTDVFEYVKGPSPCAATSGEQTTFVSIKLELRSKKKGVTTLQDGAGLRSCS